MKTTLLTLIAFAVALTSFGQSPEAFKYQSVVRNGSGVILMNQSVGFRLTIQQGSIGGTAVYTETFTSTTNGYGLANLEIGTGTTTDDFTIIDWANGPFFMETAADVTGGTSYVVMGTSQLMSVPYALYAKTSGSGGLTYLGASRAKNLGSPNPNLDNEIASGVYTKVHWMDIQENYGASIGGTSNTEITVPPNVDYLKICSCIIYDQVPPPADDRTTFRINKNGNAYAGMANSGYMTYQFFNSKYGFNTCTPMMPATAGDIYDLELRQDSGVPLYLSWGSVSSSISIEYYRQ